MINAALRMRIAFLSYVIWETETYLQQAASDGLQESLSLREFRTQLATYRVKRAVLWGQVR